MQPSVNSWWFESSRHQYWWTLTGNSAASDNFCEFIFESNLTQLVDSPTHVCGNILDLVLTNCPEHVTNLSVHPLQYQCVASDHHLITLTTSLKFNTPPPTTKEVFNLKKGIMMAWMNLWFEYILQYVRYRRNVVYFEKSYNLRLKFIYTQN